MLFDANEGGQEPDVTSLWHTIKDKRQQLRESITSRRMCVGGEMVNCCDSVYFYSYVHTHICMFVLPDSCISMHRALALTWALHFNRRDITTAKLTTVQINKKNISREKTSSGESCAKLSKLLLFTHSGNIKGEDITEGWIQWVRLWFWELCLSSVISARHI